MRKEIAEALNKYLANVGVMYVKIHNLHWNVVGGDFKPVHEYLETLYDGFAEVLDSVAESLKMNGYYPAASLKEYLALATISELDSKDVKTADALKIALEDIKTLKADAEAIRKSADADDLYDVVSLMEGNLDDYNKTIWFISSMGK